MEMTALQGLKLRSLPGEGNWPNHGTIDVAWFDQYAMAAAPQ
jgi:hypothetical protein